ncbi:MULTISPECIES: superoxide dismutase family protein [Xanthomonas]|uniref:superoxide dismutase family protein n=1 Tax=Xanthomonas TaxID=338 RepID=UPI0022538607|nr:MULTISPECIES: superoxide dismutase family protein [Xanthomonas]MCW0396589.1 Superoxide dismutase-like protein YojM [Xanthomonas sacchari]MCW0446152.1 Superoxide dismutase-like protein YojM [Xanthomonas sacchari]MDY4284759.1 superoxide dismutase family protein [Xanthomonas sp. LF06-19]MDY4341594.1 superoxide dismutase family protein [Xanthomonas sp. LF07-6]
MRYGLPLAASALLMLAACSSAPPKAPPPPPPKAPPLASAGTVQQAQAVLAPASGSLVSGKLSLVAAPGGVRITGTLGGLQPNHSFAFHVHERGDCSAADASSAGGHFNPLGAPHGRAGSGPHHAGDMDNLNATADGTAQIDVLLHGVVLGGGAANDIVGRALVAHADPDDYRSQPAGNAGARVACGVIRPLR